MPFNYSTHDNNSITMCGGAPVSLYPHLCSRCNQTYQTKQSFCRYNKKCSTNTDDNQKFLSRSICLYDGCDREFFHRTTMLNHIKIDHQECIESKLLEFENMGTFMKWKEQEEVAKFVFFSASTKKQYSSANGTTVYSYYTCHFDVENKTHRKSNDHYGLQSNK